jgi:diacylglycerol kinase (ATP)
MARIPRGPAQDPRALKGVLRSFGYAWQGLVYAWRSQRNFRIEVYLAALALGLGLLLGVDPVPVLLLVLAVLTLELLNTALEAVVDLTSPEPHPLAKAAKDTSAAAVLVASVIALVAGAWLFVPPILGKLLAYGKIP